MKALIKEKLIYCNICISWLRIDTDTYLLDGEDGKVCCLRDDNVLGYTWDKEWQRMFPILEDNEEEIIL